MRKRIRILSLILCIVTVALAFVGCSPAGAPEHSTSDPKFAVSVSDLEKELDDFINIVGNDRTSFTQAEEKAAIYLQARLAEYGYTDVLLQDFATTENNAEVNSRNVIAYYRAENRNENTKNVVLGAYYDNRYKAPYQGAAVYKSQGALANGTGVATLLTIADYFQTQKPKFDFDVTIAFFGGSFVTDVGAREFYKSGMTHAERTNTVLMVELQRLGVDHVYAYSDARQTKREPFFDGVAADYGLDIYKLTQKSPLITDATAYEGIPFYQWAHSGVFGVFFDAGIPTLNLIGANWETINLTDTESSEHANIAYTDRDDLDTLKRLHPQYAQKMATAATLVIGSLQDAEFLNVMNYDRANFPNTDVLTKNWIWYLVVLGVVIVFAAVSFAVCAHLGKKYPIVAPAPKRMKMAVFGMDYEDKDSSDIFIDIKNAPPQEDIFPEVPNNDKSAHGDIPFEDIFPSLFGAPYTKLDTENNGDKATDPFDVSDKPSDDVSANNTLDDGVIFDNSDLNDRSENTEDPKPDGASLDITGDKDAGEEGATSAAENKAVKRPAQRRTTSGTPKRKTVSAGKSNGAQTTRKSKPTISKDEEEKPSDGE